MKDDGKRVPLDVKAGDLILFGNLMIARNTSSRCARVKRRVGSWQWPAAWFW
jgi:hypothetical protein